MVQFNVHGPVQGTRSSSRYTVQFKVHCSVQGTKVHGPVQGTQSSSRYTVQFKVLRYTVQFKVLRSSSRCMAQFKVLGPVQGTPSSSRYTAQFMVEHHECHGVRRSPESQGVRQSGKVFARPPQYSFARALYQQNTALREYRLIIIFSRPHYDQIGYTV